ncbi:hypothetical protein Zmor_005157 [Zophobas morio]|uniref:Uncharacterized protein n=1 Tax=Zophobas morio TaxID=2755281 RepID=A0AA38ISH9_9CUCU|nr:hypothetical protein Zmor_005157 [Zophobas morio]
MLMRGSLARKRKLYWLGIWLEETWQNSLAVEKMEFVLANVFSVDNQITPVGMILDHFYYRQIDAWTVALKVALYLFRDECVEESWLKLAFHVSYEGYFDECPILC